MGGACENPVRLSMYDGRLETVDYMWVSDLSDLKPLHVSWIVGLYEHLKKETGMIIKGFDSAGIAEAVNNAQYVYEKTENPFRSP